MYLGLNSYLRWIIVVSDSCWLELIEMIKSQCVQCWSFEAVSKRIGDWFRIDFYWSWCVRNELILTIMNEKVESNWNYGNQSHFYSKKFRFELTFWSQNYFNWFDLMTIGLESKSSSIIEGFWLIWIWSWIRLLIF